jgi:hypothetical protein
VSGVWFWGNDNLTATTVTRFMTPGFDSASALTTETRRLRVPRAGTIQNLHVLHNTPTGNGGLIVYTLMVNGVATALTVSLASTGATAANTVSTVVVAKGDRMSIRVTKAVAIGNGNVGAGVTTEFS